MIASYFYDYRGLRSRKVTTAIAPQGVTTTFYHYDPSGHLIGESASSSVPLRTYVWNGDTLTGFIVHQPQRVVYTVQVDHLGSPFQVRSLEGKVLWRWESEAFGKSLPNEDVDGDTRKMTLNLRFPGQYFDQESGLHYNWHRYYSPKLARYLSPDPIGLAGGVNRYTYVNGNPLGAIDPLGLAQCTFDLSSGRLVCLSDVGGRSVDIPAASGNNGGGTECRNNPDCASNIGHGPIPLGCWKWTNGASGKPNGRVLVPCSDTDTNVAERRTNIRSHSCKNPFGPGRGPKYCSEGCVTATAPDIKELNELIDSEPNSRLWVEP